MITCVFWVLDRNHCDDVERQVVLVGDGLGVDHGPVVLHPLVPVHVVDDALGLAGQEPVVARHRLDSLLVELEVGDSARTRLQAGCRHLVRGVNIIVCKKPVILFFREKATTELNLTAQFGFLGWWGGHVGTCSDETSEDW